MWVSTDVSIKICFEQIQQFSYFRVGNIRKFITPLSVTVWNIGLRYIIIICKIFPVYSTWGPMLNTLERFYIYQAKQNDNQLNDKNTVTPNPIFDTVIQHSKNETPRFRTSWNDVMRQPSSNESGASTTTVTRNSIVAETKTTRRATAPVTTPETG